MHEGSWRSELFEISILTVCLNKDFLLLGTCSLEDCKVFDCVCGNWASRIHCIVIGNFELCLNVLLVLLQVPILFPKVFQCGQLAKSVICFAFFLDIVLS